MFSSYLCSDLPKLGTFPIQDEVWVQFFELQQGKNQGKSRQILVRMIPDPPTLYQKEYETMSRCYLLRFLMEVNIFRSTGPKPSPSFPLFSSSQPKTLVSWLGARSCTGNRGSFATTSVKILYTRTIPERLASELLVVSCTVLVYRCCTLYPGQKPINLAPPQHTHAALRGIQNVQNTYPKALPELC